MYRCVFHFHFIVVYCSYTARRCVTSTWTQPKEHPYEGNPMGFITYIVTCTEQEADYTESPTVWTDGSGHDSDQPAEQRPVPEYGAAGCRMWQQPNP